MQIKEPKLKIIGNLNTIVRARGNNNDDGNAWSKLVSDGHRPGIRFPKRFRLF
jgi:hypothetical protein